MPFIASEPLEIKYTNGYLWNVVAPFTYIIDSNTEVNIPANFITDLASVPQIFWNVLPPQGGSYGLPAVVHDYLYHFATITKVKDNTSEPITRKQADIILFQAMTDMKVESWKKHAIYYAVRLGGFSAWNKWRKFMADPNTNHSPDHWVS